MKKITDKKEAESINKKMTAGMLASMMAVSVLLLTACGKTDTDTPAAFVGENDTISTPEPIGAGIDEESAKDANINFNALKEENDEIFAWLQVPKTDIDKPVLQSFTDNYFYKTHNAHKEEDKEGALYIEQANVNDMCDFLTVINGKGGKEGIFKDLYRFADTDFFNENDTFYIYMDGNLLTYTIFASYSEDVRDYLVSYDLTTEKGCNEFIKDLYNINRMGMNIRDEWEEGAISPYHFLTALIAGDDKENTQYVVIGCLTNDAAGKIDRQFADYSYDWDINSVSTP